MAKKQTVFELDIFQTLEMYPQTIVDNAGVGDFSNLDLEKNVLICNVKKDNVAHFLDGSAKIYYTGKKFPSTVALNKLYYFMPYIGKDCKQGFYGIRDLYLIRTARVGCRREGEMDNNPNDLRIVFELKFVKHLYDEYYPIKLKIWDTYTDTQLSKMATEPRLLKPRQKKGKDLNVLSLFSGCGGMDLGFEGGFTCLRKSVPNDSIWIDKVLNEKWVRLKPTRFGLCFANDILHEAQVAWVNYFRNFGYDPSIYRTQSIVDLVKAHYQIGNIFPGEIDVITGGFPCQDFSVAGKRQGFQSQKDHNGNKRDTDEPSEETRGKLYI